MSMEIIRLGGGIRRTTAITSAAAAIWDMTACVGCYFDLFGNQDFVYAMSSSNAAGAMLVAGELNASGSVPDPRTATSSVDCPVLANTREPVQVSAKTPYLHVRAVSADVTLFRAIPSSDVKA